VKQEFYHYKVSEDYLSFTFESISSGRKIIKVVEYVPIDENVYNLAFGDIGEDGLLNDLSKSSNQDMEKVLATVIQTVFVFFELNYDKALFFKGSTSARTRLYQVIISKEKANWKERFVIFGVKFDDEVELFEKNINYEAFVIRLK